MFSFDPPKRAMLSSIASESDSNNEAERVYIHGIDKDSIIVETKFGVVSVVPTTKFTIRFDPNSASLAEAFLRLQGMELARMPDDRKKHDHESV